MLSNTVLRGRPSLMHALYADDIFIFCRGDKKSLTSLNNFLEVYSQSFEQQIKKIKSLFILGNFARPRTALIKSIFDFVEGSLPFNYLGVPIFIGCPKRNHLQALGNQASSILNGWHWKILSMAGRVEFVKTVFQSILFPSFKVYYWPTSFKTASLFGSSFFHFK